MVSLTYVSKPNANQLLMLQADTLTAMDASEGLMIGRISNTILKLVSLFSFR